MTDETIEVLTCQYSDITKRYVCTGVRKIEGVEYISLFESSRDLARGDRVQEEDVSEQSISKRNLPERDTYIVWEYVKHSLIGYLLADLNTGGPVQSLVIGLGNATVPRFISTLNPEDGILCIEINPAVVDIARKEFDYQGVVLVGDALQVLPSVEGKYDYILVDCFVGDDDLSVMSGMASPDFVQALDERLSRDGVLVVNQGSTESRKEMRMARAFIAQLEARGFPEPILVTSRDEDDSANQILIVTRKSLRARKLRIRVNAAFSDVEEVRDILEELNTATLQ